MCHHRVHLYIVVHFRVHLIDYGILFLKCVREAGSLNSFKENIKFNLSSRHTKQHKDVCIYILLKRF